MLDELVLPDAAVDEEDALVELAAVLAAALPAVEALAELLDCATA